MHRTRSAVLSAVTLVAAFGLSGCAAAATPSAEPAQSRVRSTTSTTTAAVAPLPAPDALTSVVATLADRKYQDAAAKGYFPVTFTVVDIDQNGPVVTANVTAAANTGGTATQPVVFVSGPSPTGYQITKESALAVMSAVG